VSYYGKIQTKFRLKQEYAQVQNSKLQKFHQKDFALLPFIFFYFFKEHWGK